MMYVADEFEESPYPMGGEVDADQSLSLQDIFGALWPVLGEDLGAEFSMGDGGHVAIGV